MVLMVKSQKQVVFISVKQEIYDRSVQLQEDENLFPVYFL